MTPSLEGSTTKAKEAPSPHEVRPAPLDTNPVLQCLTESISLLYNEQFHYSATLKHRSTQKQETRSTYLMCRKS